VNVVNISASPWLGSHRSVFRSVHQSSLNMMQKSVIWNDKCILSCSGIDPCTLRQTLRNE
jgi:hypothetical protein